MLLLDIVGLSLTVRRGSKGSMPVSHVIGQEVVILPLSAKRGDTQPLLVQAPAFITAVIGQSSSFLSDINTLYVTLATNVDLLALNASKITISGLTRKCIS